MLRTDVRILASTSANIEHALAEKKLREDLYYRLSDVTVHVPPLRQRKEDVRVLLRHFHALPGKALRTALARVLPEGH